MNGNRNGKGSPKEDKKTVSSPSSLESVNTIANEETESESDYNSYETSLFTSFDVANNNFETEHCRREETTNNHKILDVNSCTDLFNKNVEKVAINIKSFSNNNLKKGPKYGNLFQRFVPQNPVFHVYVSDFINRLFGKSNKKKRVRFADAQSAASPEESRFWVRDGKCIPIPTTEDVPPIPYACKMTVTESDYIIGCCVKYRDKKDFKHELEVTIRKSFTEKLKEFSKVQDLVQNFIRFEYWSTVQHIMKTVDFRQPDREEDEVGPIATKMWLFTFIVDDLFQDMNLPPGSLQRKKLEAFWDNFLVTREKIWNETNQTIKHCQKFVKFALETYRAMKYIGRKFGLKIQIEKSFFRFNYGAGLQLVDMSQRDFESRCPVELQFQEKQTLHWHDFSLAPLEEQYRFLNDLLQEITADLIHVGTNFEFFIKELIQGKIYPKDVSFSKGLRQFHDCIQFFLQSPSTSIAEYDRIQTFIKEFSLELMAFFNNIRHILLRATAVCDVTELSAIYLSNKYGSLQTKFTPKYHKTFCRNKKIYNYKEVDFIKTFHQQALLINTKLVTKHCNLTFRYFREPIREISPQNMLSSEEKGDNCTEENEESLQKYELQTAIVEDNVSNCSTQPQHTISIYSYLNSDEYKLKSILKSKSIH